MEAAGELPYSIVHIKGTKPQWKLKHLKTRKEVRHTRCVFPRACCSHLIPILLRIFKIRNRF